MLPTGDLDSIHLAFRRLVGVLVRCQSPSVASQLNIWSISLVESREERLASKQPVGRWEPVISRMSTEEWGSFSMQLFHSGGLT